MSRETDDRIPDAGRIIGYSNGFCKYVDDKNSFCNSLCLQLLSPDGRWIVLVSIAVLMVMVVGMEGISRFVLASPFYHRKIGIFGLWTALLLYLPPIL
jgi:hypothetical protein